MSRTRWMHALGGTCIALGMLALLVGAPLALMVAWSTSGRLVAGVEASALVGVLGIVMLTANWVVFGLGQETAVNRTG